LSFKNTIVKTKLFVNSLRDLLFLVALYYFLCLK